MSGLPSTMTEERRNIFKKLQQETQDKWSESGFVIRGIKALDVLSSESFMNMASAEVKMCSVEMNLLAVKINPSLRDTDPSYVETLETMMKIVDAVKGLLGKKDVVVDNNSKETDK